MTYALDEASVEGGAPVELYEFIGSDPAVNTFRMTSADADVTFDPGDGKGSRTFYAIPIKRTGVETNQDGKDPTITVSVPADTNIAKRYIFQVAPPNLYMTMFRVHIGVGSEQVIVGWEGEVISWYAEENLANFVIPSVLVARANETIPRVKYQQYCNNVLYDTICGISKSGDNVHAAFIAEFISDRVVRVGTMGTKPDGWLNGGEITHDATGETRLVLGQVGSELTILYPFSQNVDVNDPVTVARGCDHSLDDCVNKFNQPNGNQDNFNGFPFIVTQATNPTQSGD